MPWDPLVSTPGRTWRGSARGTRQGGTLWFAVSDGGRSGECSAHIVRKFFINPRPPCCKIEEVEKEKETLVR
jgi:hypothetical protein